MRSFRTIIDFSLHMVSFPFCFGFGLASVFGKNFSHSTPKFSNFPWQNFKTVVKCRCVLFCAVYQRFFRSALVNNCLRSFRFVCPRLTGAKREKIETENPIPCADQEGLGAHGRGVDFCRVHAYYNPANPACQVLFENFLHFYYLHKNTSNICTLCTK